MNQDTALREAREWAEKYWAAQAEVERLGRVATKAIIEREWLRDEVERLREALRHVVRAADALHEAEIGNGHPGVEHDHDLRDERPADDVRDDCLSCVSAQCDAEDVLATAYERARAALARELKP
jgi:hypothetical protein